MVNRSKIVTALIKKYENGYISKEEAVKSINQNTNNPIEIYDLQNYWRSENLEDFVERITYESLKDWKQIDDKTALKLIEEIQKNWNDISIRERNSEALEKRYAKTSGYMISILNESPREILKRLKEDNTIYL